MKSTYQNAIQNCENFADLNQAGSFKKRCKIFGTVTHGDFWIQNRITWNHFGWWSIADGLALDFEPRMFLIAHLDDFWIEVKTLILFEQSWWQIMTKSLTNLTNPNTFGTDRYHFGLKWPGKFSQCDFHILIKVFRWALSKSMYIWKIIKGTIKPIFITNQGYSMRKK